MDSEIERGTKVTGKGKETQSACLLVDHIKDKDNRRAMFQAAIGVIYTRTWKKIYVQILSKAESRAESMQHHALDRS